MSDDLHRLVIFDDDEWAEETARLLAERIQTIIDARGHCTFALSGGSTPAPVFHALAQRELDWDRVVLLQADERVVPADDPARNLVMQREAFADLPVAWLPLPVDQLLEEGTALDLDPASAPPIAERSGAVAAFVEQLHRLADDPAVVDVIHLGLGDDGHTASLFPDDPALQVLRDPVAVTGEQAGHRRMTLTRPVLDRARSVFWLVRGSSKVPALGRLLAGDLAIPAGLVMPAMSVVVADAAAARQA
ncbi:MAG: 6-phosphogluconolactonase [Actinomycetota bacterium]